MAAAAGKQNTTSLRCPFFLEAFGLGVEEALHAMPTQTWAEGSVDWKIAHRAKRNMVEGFELQTWRRVRGSAGVVTCETRDLGIDVAAAARPDT